MTTAKKCLEYLVDTFTGADGGVRFLRLRIMLEEMDKRADAGDVAAKGVLQIAERFCRLIEISDTNQKGDAK